ncbi:MAG: membrane protease YdiL (CAAX protease family) [Verrucomicrobiales bacterium]|jgi:membrane protease YdiL (CAAX protease family)
MSIVEKALITDTANLSVLLLGIGLLAGLLLKRLPAKTLAPMPVEPAVTTKKWDVPELLLALVLFALIYTFILLDVNRDSVSPALVRMRSFMGQLQQPVFVVVILLMLVVVRKRDVIEVWGLNKLTPPKITVTGIFLIASTALTLFVYQLFQHFVLKDLVGTPPAQPQIQQLRENKSAPLVISMIIGACVLAPLYEEIIFRGFLYPALKRFVQPVVAAIVISGIFAAAHTNLGALLPLGVLSLMLILAYEVTGSLLVPMIVHSGFNLCNIIITLNEAGG